MGSLSTCVFGYLLSQSLERAQGTGVVGVGLQLLTEREVGLHDSRSPTEVRLGRREGRFVHGASGAPIHCVTGSLGFTDSSHECVHLASGLGTQGRELGPLGRRDPVTEVPLVPLGQQHDGRPERSRILGERGGVCHRGRAGEERHGEERHDERSTQDHEGPTQETEGEFRS